MPECGNTGAGGAAPGGAEPGGAATGEGRRAEDGRRRARGFEAAAPGEAHPPTTSSNWRRDGGAQGGPRVYGRIGFTPPRPGRSRSTGTLRPAFRSAAASRPSGGGRRGAWMEACGGAGKAPVETVAEHIGCTPKMVRRRVSRMKLYRVDGGVINAR